MHRSFDKVSKMIKSKALEFTFQLNWNLLQFIRVFRPQWRLRRREMRPGVRCLLCVQVESEELLFRWSEVLSPFQGHRMQRHDLAELHPHPEPALPRRLHGHHLLRVHPNQGQLRHLPVQAGFCQLRGHGT